MLGKVSVGSNTAVQCFFSSSANFRFGNFPPHQFLATIFFSLFPFGPKKKLFILLEFFFVAICCPKLFSY